MSSHGQNGRRDSRSELKPLRMELSVNEFSVFVLILLMLSVADWMRLMMD